MPRLPLRITFAPLVPRLTRFGPILFTLALAGLAAAPLLSHAGFLHTRGGGDSPFLLLRLHQLEAALQAGEFPARWMPEAAYGYGYPFFNYYAALPYYLAALFHWYGFSYAGALKLAQLGALLAAAAGAYAWARSLPTGIGQQEGLGLSRPQAVLAAAAYTFAPFHLVNLYVRGDSLSELWAMAFYPLILRSAQRCLDRPSLGRALGLAVFTGLLAVTHNISALNFMPFAALYVLLVGGGRLWSSQRLASAGPVPASRPLLAGALALGWGLLLAAFFWLPALRETEAVQIGDVTQGYFFYGNHFRAADLVQRSLFFSYETGPGEPTPFSMGLAQALAAAAGLAVWLWRAMRVRAWSAADSFVLLGLGLSTLMITPASAWIWEHLPLVRFTQFPWRFLSIQALFVALVIARLAPAARPTAGRATGFARRWGITVVVSLGLALFSLGWLRPDFIPLRDSDVTAQRLQLLEQFTLNIGSTIGYEYLPRAVQPRPFGSEALLDRPPRLKALQGQASGERLWRRGAAEAWRITALGPATVAVPTYYWPGWTAQVDGQSVMVQAASGLGWISFTVPAGTHDVHLQLRPTPLRRAAEGVSLLALAAPLAYLAYRYWRSPRRLHRASVSAASPTALRVLLPAAGLTVATALALRAAPVPPSGPPLPLSFDFIQLTYPHYDIVRFAGGGELVSLEYDRDRLARGESLRVVTGWKLPAPGAATLRLVPASNLLSARPVTVSQATQPVPASPAAATTVAYVLEVPGDIPPGLYFVTVELAGAAGPQPALTLAGRERGLVHLAPVRIDDAGPAAPAAEPVARFGPAVELLAAQATTPEPGSLALDLLWRAALDVPGNYVLAARLRDAAGLEWAALDAQTAYGFYPTHAWRPGEIVPDVYRLALPAGTPPGNYALTLSLYDAASGSTLGDVALSAMLTATTPAVGHEPEHTLTPEVALGAVEFPRQFNQGDAPELRAEWLTVGTPRQPLRARWTLTPQPGSSPEAGLLALDLDLAPGSSPAAWPAGAYVLGRNRFGTPPSLVPGVYDFSVVLIDAAGQPVGQTAQLGPVEVTGRARRFDVPALETDVGATYGGLLKLWGYNAERAGDELRLTLVWGALETPAADYKYFVHLFNADDEVVVRQVDAMPLNFTYATALWVKDEVVVDPITLSLAGLPPGTYRLSLGWYDPDHPEHRLPAFDAAGQAQPGDRVVLPLVIEVP